MTAEEAIAILNGAEVMVLNRNPQVFTAAVGRAITSLFLEKQRNNPRQLTIEDLRQMDGEPVWMVWSDGRIKSKWWIVGSCDWLAMDFDDPIMVKRYGSDWVTYRHKLREE